MFPYVHCNVSLCETQNTNLHEERGMKALRMMCLLSLMVGTAQALDIPGGVVALNKAGRLTYFDFRTEKSGPITQESVNVTSPFAVSEDGKTAVWMENGKLHQCSLPNGEDRLAKRENIMAKTGVKTKPEGVLFELAKDYEFNSAVITNGHWVGQGQNLANNEVSNLTISPKGTKISFEAEMQATRGWSLANAQTDQAWKLRNPGSNSKNLPMNVRQAGGVFYGAFVSVINEARPGKYRKDFLSFEFRCGNAVEYPSTPTWRGTSGFAPIGPMGGTHESEMFSPPIVWGIKGWDIQDACQRYSYRRDVHHFCWSKNDRRCAWIYKTQSSWGRVEIRTFAVTTQKYGSGGAGGFFEVFLDLRISSCEGLAWTPDDSLLIRANKKLYKISAAEIDEGIKNVTRVPMSGALYVSTPFVLKNNVFRSKPEELPVYDLEGTNLCWVTNTVFIIRRPDGGLYAHDLANGGRPEKILSRIPAEFCYTSGIPTDSGSLAGAPRH